MKHPEELLASFVDGTATLPERAEIEAHLSFCPTCRGEVELARTARAALMALPEVESPGPAIFTPPVTEPVGAATGPVAESGGGGRFVGSPGEDFVPLPARARRSPPARRPARRWPVRVAQAAVGVAAVSLGVLIVSHLGGQSDKTASAPAPAAAAGSPTGGVRVEPRPIQAYTAKSFRRLANDLVGEVRQQVARGSSLTGSPVSPVASPEDTASLSERASSCIEQGTGVVAGTRLYYVQQALYEGTDAYIGAFVTGTGSSRSLLVVAVTVDGCQALQFIRQAV